MSDDPKCVAGCVPFYGGEKRHHKDCPYYPESLTKLNADRIEELEERLKAATDDAKEAEAYAGELEAENRLLRDAVYIDDLTVTMQASDRSKAIECIGRALNFLNADMLGEAKTALRATLAELTGGKDE